MPTVIDFGGGKKVEMTYDAAGVMLTKKVYNTGAVLVENRTYNNGMEFVAYGTGNQVLELVHHSQGYFKPAVSRHIYTIKDHLGNNRIVYTDANNDGSIAQSSTEILDENHYYSYGMEMTDPSWYNGTEYKYKFNGIERTESIGLNIDLALYRGLDPVLGKWYQVDPKAEVMGNMSPYCAMNNNPVSYSDPEGDLPFLAVVAIGAATGILSNGLVNISSDRSFFDGAGKAALWGGIGAAASAGVGAVFGASGAFGHEFLRAGAHAVTQGGIAVAQGGSFWQGAASGGIGSGISSGIAALGGTAGHQIVGGGIGGGIGSSMNGGNFWQGFGQGIAVGAFNHALQNGIIYRIRNQIAENAEAEIGSKEWNYDIEKDNFDANTNKCNKFVYDMLLQSGADPGTPNGFFGDNPPTAGQWADPNYKIQGWKVVGKPSRGDVVAYQYNYSDATGHVAIIGANARAFRYSVGTSGGVTIAKTLFGFSTNTKFLPSGANYVYRRYTGK